MTLHLQGKSFPLGSQLEKNGVNFSVFSKNATGVELLLFSDAQETEPSIVIRLDPQKNKTYHYWHAFVPGITAGQLYGYRMKGPNSPSDGHRFDSTKTLLDPYAKAVVFHPDCPKSVVCDLKNYNWNGDEHPKRPFSQTVIYEMHVGGFTKNPNSGVPPEKRGTFAGLIEKIPYLKDLGITAVELLPVFQFEDRLENGHVNYWGYNPISFFALHRDYSSQPDPLKAMDEFRDMVKALHQAGIEVILDVVFNHTGEGGENGPTYSFKGIDNRIYYTLDKEDQSRYLNYSGCGNILNANHPIVRRMIIDSLHYWVKYMHVDGFRFDLASILSRNEKGQPIENAPILWDIESDPILAGTKLIAEAWDVGGLYQVGTFIGDSWNEWNGKFRDDVRGFLRGDKGKVKDFISRLIGSPDLYGHQDREPEQSINFVTCHDGFTLNDLVSYSHKHNELNGEGNLDGANENLSQNGGVEGPTHDPRIEAWRIRQIKNFFAVTLFAMGAPMITMGDEIRRTQLGNNNAYCQDNELSWFDWDLVKENQGLFRFVKMLIARRLLREANVTPNTMSLKEFLDKGEITWHGVRLNEPDWSENSHSTAFTVISMAGSTTMHVMVNAFLDVLEFQVPPPKSKSWKIWMDTFQSSPNDIFEWLEGPEFPNSNCRVEANSILILVS
jgi:glycogen operon protein